MPDPYEYQLLTPEEMAEIRDGRVRDIARHMERELFALEAADEQDPAGRSGRYQARNQLRARLEQILGLTYRNGHSGPPGKRRPPEPNPQPQPEPAVEPVQEPTHPDA